ncbi:MAG: 3-hydroxyanthranilate 3,4-dioxygenase [Planctomycetaceae bacterium]|nr:3-hydroxyanthranilate 3,4-dioxygenase [Planctomycetaceae bacterium]
MISPINFKQWIEDHRHLLKPPVGNQVVYTDTDFIVMVVGGPNARKDFHYNEGEEFFYQIEGDINLALMVDGELQNIEIKEGEIFLLPPRIPHSPQRGPNTVGLVIERQRLPNEKDACIWFCESCNQELCRADFQLNDIVKQLPMLMNSFYKDEIKRTCPHCQTVMQPPT